MEFQQTSVDGVGPMLGVFREPPHGGFEVFKCVNRLGQLEVKEELTRGRVVGEGVSGVLAVGGVVFLQQSESDRWTVRLRHWWHRAIKMKAFLEVFLEVDAEAIAKFQSAGSGGFNFESIRPDEAAEFGNEGVPVFGVRHKEVSGFSEEGFDHRGHRAHRGGVVGVV